MHCRFRLAVESVLPVLNRFISKRIIYRRISLNLLLWQPWWGAKQTHLRSNASSHHISTAFKRGVGQWTKPTHCYHRSTIIWSEDSAARNSAKRPWTLPITILHACTRYVKIIRKENVDKSLHTTDEAASSVSCYVYVYLRHVSAINYEIYSNGSRTVGLLKILELDLCRPW